MGFLKKVQTTVDGGIQKAYKRVGVTVARNPCATIGVALLFFAACMGGISQYSNEGRGEKLWAPEGGDDVRHLEEVSNAFAPSARSNIMFVVAKDGGNILTKDALLEILQVETAIRNLTVNEVGRDTPDTKRVWTFDDLCDKRGPTCTFSSVLQLFGDNATQIEDAAASAQGIAGTLSTLRDAVPPTLPPSGQPFNWDLSLGGATAAKGSGALTSAKLIRVSFQLENRQYLLPSNEYIDPPAQEFEKAAFDLIGAPDTQTYSHIRIVANFRESTREESSKAIFGDLGLVGGSIGLIILYVALQLGNCTRVGNRLALALGAVGTIGCALGVAYGIGSIFTPYSPIHSVLPFLVFGIGVDDCFVIVNEYDLAGVRLAKRNMRTRRTRKAGREEGVVPVSPRDGGGNVTWLRYVTLEEQVGEAMGHAGSSITVTSLTNFLAFLISSMTVLPALAWFCIWAAVAVTAALFFSCTLFCALLVLDGRRQRSQRMDCCCCCSVGDGRPTTQGDVEDAASVSPTARDTQVSPVVEEDIRMTGCCGRKQGELLRDFVDKTYAPLLSNKVVKVLVIVAFVSYSCVAAVGISNLEIEFRREWFLPGDSFLQEYYSLEREYFSGFGVPAGVYAKDFEPYDHRAGLVALRTAFDNNAYTDTAIPVRDWYSSFTDAMTTASLDVNAMDKATFDTQLAAFVANPANARVAGDVVFAKDAAGSATSMVHFSRFVGFYKGMSKADEELEAMLTLISDVDAAAAAHGLTGRAYAFAFTFTSWRQFDVIPREAFTNVALAIAAVFVVVTIFTASVHVAALTTLVVALVLLDVLGTMVYWGVYLDSVSVVQLTLAVGLSVDYSAHIAHAFLHKSGTRDERARLALSEMGVSVMNGAASTFLAVCLLSLSKSYIFVVFFKMFFMTAVFGATHGLILLPVILSLIGPPEAEHDDNEEAAKPVDVEMAGKPASGDEPSSIG